VPAHSECVRALEYILFANYLFICQECDIVSALKNVHTYYVTVGLYYVVTSN
jgi:hypothetical protein